MTKNANAPVQTDLISHLSGTLLATISPQSQIEMQLIFRHFRILPSALFILLLDSMDINNVPAQMQLAEIQLMLTRHYNQRLEHQR